MSRAADGTFILLAAACEQALANGEQLDPPLDGEITAAITRLRDLLLQELEPRRSA